LEEQVSIGGMAEARMPTIESGRLRMDVSVAAEPLIQHVEVTDEEITADLADGRRISVPLAWSWRLSEATLERRKNFRILGSGQGVRWPEIDEDLSVRGMLEGTPAPRPKQRA
jgi:hypothetical protein